MPLTKSTIQHLHARLMAEQKKLSELIAEFKRDDPFQDPDHASDNAAIDTDVREQIGHETIEAELKDFTRRLERIDSALKKIDKGDYGICERCGIDIVHARLDFLPEARYCIDCEKRLVK